MIDSRILEEIDALDKAGGIVVSLIEDAVRRENWKAFDKLRKVFSILRNTRLELVEKLQAPDNPFLTN